MCKGGRGLGKQRKKGSKDYYYKKIILWIQSHKYKKVPVLGMRRRNCLGPSDFILGYGSRRTSRVGLHGSIMRTLTAVVARGRRHFRVHDRGIAEINRDGSMPVPTTHGFLATSQMYK